MFGDARLPERFWSKVSVHESGCWLWTAALTMPGMGGAGGYGRIRLNDRGTSHALAHRFSYERLVGAVPDGLQLDHLCRVRRCVNPTHLEPVTPRENTMRSSSFIPDNAAKTHCDSGHAFDRKNTHVDSKGHRVCRTCNRLNARRRREASGEGRKLRPWMRLSP